MKKSCGNCANHIEGADRFSKPCSNCVAAILDNGEVTDPSHWKPKPKPMTNADRIRAMTDEELAEFLEGDYGNMAVGWALEWLQQPAEGD